MIGVRAIFDVSDLRKRAAQIQLDLTPAFRRFFQRIAALVEANTGKHLSGSGAPGAYPVPVRTGTLLGSLASEFDESSATVFATAEYAGSVITGYRAYGRPNGKVIPARPYLPDGINDTDIAGELNDALQRVFA